MRVAGCGRQEMATQKCEVKERWDKGDRENEN